MERYRSPRSGSTTTTSLPAFSGREATWIAPTMAAPHEIPQSIPSSRASRRAISNASSSRTVTTSSMIDVFKTSGMNPAPIPWILCGPGRSDSLRRNWLMTGEVDRLDRDRPAPTACGSSRPRRSP